VADGAVSLRPGVLRLMDEALQQGLRLAIATTTSPVNIAALLRKAIGADWRMHFVAIGDASTAPNKKPHPQVYLQMLSALDLPAVSAWRLRIRPTGCRQPRQRGFAP
jgi:beta-phosphoglucomutase-like phosphatase (HAD superfamily)